MKPYRLALCCIVLAWLVLVIAGLAFYTRGAGMSVMTLVFVLALGVISATEVVRLTRVLRRQEVRARHKTNR